MRKKDDVFCKMVYNTIMKIILTTLNSKFIHSNLALRDLRAYCKKDYPNIKILEYTVNDSYDMVIAGLVSEKPELLCFSTYIWNIQQTLDIISSIVKILPQCKILLGGPEVSYDGIEWMKTYHFVDYIIAGEGEKTFFEFLDCITGKGDFGQVNGLIWRKDDGSIIENDVRSPIALDDIPFAYEDGFHDLTNKIIYYETSRGCPFRCQYCLSSTTGGVRYLSMDRIKRELAFFVKSGVKQVKLVDRTFNCNPARAREIFSYILELGGETNFHMELAGDLIDGETLELLSQAPVGLFQFEIGIQSTKEVTLAAIQRKSNLDKVNCAVSKLLAMDNIHIHLDLIAGLPEEDLESMAKSINEVLKLRPHRLQLGFLKLLRGSGLRNQAKEYKYSFTDYPPYEVLSSHVISFEELLRLKWIEELLEHYYNSHRFDRSIDYLIKKAEGNAFKVFDEMADFWHLNGYFRYSHSFIWYYEALLQYADTLNYIDRDLFRDLLRFDYVRHQRPGRYPEGLEVVIDNQITNQIHEFLKKEQNIVKYLTNYTGQSVKQILRRVHPEVFNYRLDLEGEASYVKEQSIILFDYDNPAGVLGKAGFFRIKV